MSDTETDKGKVEPPAPAPAPTSEQESTMATDTTPTTTEETQQEQSETQETKPAAETLTSKFNNMSLSIWPPTQRTRNAVIDRLIQTLSTPSVLSKRYGSLSPDEASSAARLIEEEAFTIATVAFSAPSTDPTNAADGGIDEDDRGINILQIYSKEISKRMLEAVKAKANAGSGADDKDSVKAEEPATSEEISSTEPESSTS